LYQSTVFVVREDSWGLRIHGATDSWGYGFIHNFKGISFSALPYLGKQKKDAQCEERHVQCPKDFHVISV